MSSIVVSVLTDQIYTSRSKIYSDIPICSKKLLEFV